MPVLYDPLWDKLVSAAERAARLDRIGEPMLELSDPVWNKLDDEHRDRHTKNPYTSAALRWRGRGRASCRNVPVRGRDAFATRGWGCRRPKVRP
jgi:hypothetical protein